MNQRTRKALFGLLALCAAFVVSGCGEVDGRTDRGELIPLLADTGLEIRYRSIKAPEGIPVLETVAGQARDSDGRSVDFALVVWEPAAQGRTWNPIVIGAQRSGRIGNVELMLPHNAPASLVKEIRDTVRATAPEAP